MQPLPSSLLERPWLGEDCTVMPAFVDVSPTSSAVFCDHSSAMSPLILPSFHLPSPSVDLSCDRLSFSSSPSFTTFLESVVSNDDLGEPPAGASAAAESLHVASGGVLQQMSDGLRDSDHQEPMQRPLHPKLRHRAMDARRRQREAIVLRRMQSLLWKTEDVAAETGPEFASAGCEQPRRSRLKTDKLSILESCAQRIMEMTAALHSLSDACNNKDRHIAQLTRQVQAMTVTHSDTFRSMSSSIASASLSSPTLAPLSTSLPSLHPVLWSCINQLDSSVSLHASRLVGSPLCMLLFSIPEGRLLDANSELLIRSGWTRDALVNTVVATPQQRLDLPDDTRLCPLTDRVERVKGGGRGRVLQTAQQYPSTKTAMHELWAGSQRKVDVTWRMFKADGVLYETRQSVWLQEHSMEDEEEASQGAAVLAARLMVMACVLDDAYRVS